MMWIKICGWRDPETLARAHDPAPDAIGLNFYLPSPRSVSVETAARMVRSLPSGIEAVGLFVNHSAEDVRRIAAECGLRTIQLHGDEPPEFLSALGSLRVIRALRLPADTRLDAVRDNLAATMRTGHRPWAYLLEPQVAGTFGGSGATMDWSILQDWPAEWPALILAGGLTPANVADAIRTARPWGVDVASGVEESRGVKSPGLTAEFIRAARSA